MKKEIKPDEPAFLEEGDIITIKPGMQIYVELPETFVYSNGKDPKKLAQTNIKVGEVRTNGAGETLNTKKFAGSYLVQDARSQGGGTGHGPGDVYPDGHHIIATKLKSGNEYNPNGGLISFYQSGCFNAMIEPKDIQAEGKLQKTWIPIPEKTSKPKMK